MIDIEKELEKIKNVNFRLPTKKYKQLLKLANKLTNGNVSRLIRAIIEAELKGKTVK